MAATRRCANLDRDDVILRSEAMGQLGFFDADRRLAALSEKGDPNFVYNVRRLATLKRMAAA